MPYAHRRFGAVCGVVLLALAVSGCGETRKALGWEKTAPDEFAVVSRAPLSMPPDFRLRPPQPGAPRPQEASARDMAREAVVGGASQHVSGRSGAEATLLSKAGAGQVEPGIRTAVNRETQVLADAERSFTDRLVFWRDTEPNSGPLVDPRKESQRIRENQALGKPANSGETPVIQRRQKGLLEGIF